MLTNVRLRPCIELNAQGMGANVYTDSFRFLQWTNPNKLRRRLNLCAQWVFECNLSDTATALRVWTLAELGG